MRIGIDADGVLRDFNAGVIQKISETHPNLVEKIQPIETWDIESWLPFWTAKKGYEYIFDNNFKDIFEKAPPCRDSKEHWNSIQKWAAARNHQLVLVSAQEKQCIAPTLSWLGNHKFSFDEIHFTKNKETVDIDILVDDYDKNLINFSNIGKLAICFSHPYNKDIQDLFITISSLKELPAVVDTIEAEKNLVDTVATMA